MQFFYTTSVFFQGRLLLFIFLLGFSYNLSTKETEYSYNIMNFVKKNNKRILLSISGISFFIVLILVRYIVYNRSNKGEVGDSSCVNGLPVVEDSPCVNGLPVVEDSSCVNGLPVELRQHILNFLDPVDLGLCSLINRQHKNIVKAIINNIIGNEYTIRDKLFMKKLIKLLFMKEKIKNLLTMRDELQKIVRNHQDNLLNISSMNEIKKFYFVWYFFKYAIGFNPFISLAWRGKSVLCLDIMPFLENTFLTTNKQLCCTVKNNTWSLCLNKVNSFCLNKDYSSNWILILEAKKGLNSKYCAVDIEYYSPSDLTDIQKNFIEEKKLFKEQFRRQNFDEKSSWYVIMIRNYKRNFHDSINFNEKYVEKYGKIKQFTLFFYALNLNEDSLNSFKNLKRVMFDNIHETRYYSGYDIPQLPENNPIEHVICCHQFCHSTKLKKLVSGQDYITLLEKNITPYDDNVNIKFITIFQNQQYKKNSSIVSDFIET